MGGIGSLFAVAGLPLAELLIDDEQARAALAGETDAAEQPARHCLLLDLLGLSSFEGMGMGLSLAKLPKRRPSWSLATLALILMRRFSRLVRGSKMASSPLRGQVTRAALASGKMAARMG